MQVLANSFGISIPQTSTPDIYTHSIKLNTCWATLEKTYTFCNQQEDQQTIAASKIHEVNIRLILPKALKRNYYIVIKEIYTIR